MLTLFEILGVTVPAEAATLAPDGNANTSASSDPAAAVTDAPVALPDIDPEADPAAAVAEAPARTALTEGVTVPALAVADAPVIDVLSEATVDPAAVVAAAPVSEADTLGTVNPAEQVTDAPEMLELPDVVVVMGPADAVAAAPRIETPISAVVDPADAVAAAPEGETLTEAVADPAEAVAAAPVIETETFPPPPVAGISSSAPSRFELMRFMADQFVPAVQPLPIREVLAAAPEVPGAELVPPCKLTFPLDNPAPSRATRMSSTAVWVRAQPPRLTFKQETTSDAETVTDVSDVQFGPSSEASDVSPVRLSAGSTPLLEKSRSVICEHPVSVTDVRAEFDAPKD